MKFVVSSSALQSHLQVISRVINSKTTMPALECFLINIQGKTLTATASDTETTLVASMEIIESDGDGLFAIPARTLLDSLRELSEQPLTLDINMDTFEVVVYYQNGKYKFVAQDGKIYPAMKQMSEQTTLVELPAETLLRGINCTLFASADDDIRPVMNGFVMDISTENITFVASDAHKLVRMTCTQIHGNEANTLIIPKKPATVLRAILPKEAGMVRVEFDENNVLFGLSNYKMYCRLVEGRFPNYNAVIPKNNPFKVLVERVSFLNALKRVSAFANQSTGLMRLSISNNNIFLISQDLDFSTSAEENVACQYDGNPLVIGFKGQFLMDIVSNLETKDIIMELADPSRATILMPDENAEGEDLLMLLMPMLLND